MQNDSTWIICRHVIKGSADHVNLHPHKLCICSTCSENNNPVKLGSVCILNQHHLECSLHGVKQIDGLRYIGRFRDHRGNFITENRQNRERRSREDRRLGGDFLLQGKEERRLSTDRRIMERRAEISHS